MATPLTCLRRFEALIIDDEEDMKRKGEGGGETEVGEEEGQGWNTI